ncbi:unnamed protein product [marine sediment metagenome]|uniref:Uncharacterized protein n=1 Tax=marine sediment metagenome TaxID=412755 RepID=X1IMI6_9ZZZZ
MDYLDVMINICPHCPYNKRYRIGIKCTKFKDYPYYLDECPNLKNVVIPLKLVDLDKPIEKKTVSFEVSL